MILLRQVVRLIRGTLIGVNYKDMYWKLILSQEKGALELWQESTLLAKHEWQETRNTSQDILKALESIRADQNLSWSQISEFQLELTLSPHATSRRIAETFQKTYTAFAV